MQTKMTQGDVLEFFMYDQRFYPEASLISNLKNSIPKCAVKPFFYNYGTMKVLLVKMTANHSAELRKMLQELQTSTEFSKCCQFMCMRRLEE